MSTRSHTADLPHPSRSVRDCPWASSLDGEVEEEYTQAHARPRSTSSISRHHNSSSVAVRKRASTGYTESTSAIQTLHSRRRSPVPTDKRGASPNFHAKTDVLSFLDPDSPDLTAESIRRTLETSTLWHREPASTSPCSSAGSSSTSSAGTGSSRAGGTSEHDTEAQTSPEPSIHGDIMGTTSTQAASNVQPGLLPPGSKSTTDAKAATRVKHTKYKEYHYGTPEMPRGTANLPHIPPSALTPRVSHPGQGHVKHLPRAEKLPLTGYELLAARLSASSSRPPLRSRRREQPASPSSDRSNPSPSPRIKPIYRRFESLNHRLLLHLQDELSELEEQLHRLDTADTQTRRLQNCILPASRRAEFHSGGELQWHKTDILGKIGFKLGQYNHALASFREAQDLPSPEGDDVEVYRTYLARENPIAENETRFLEVGDDLVLLARQGGEGAGRDRSSSSESDYGCRERRYSPSVLEDEAPTPRQGNIGGFVPKMTRWVPGGGFLPTPSLSPASSVAAGSRPGTSAGGEGGETPMVSETTPSAGKSLWLLAVVLILLPALLLRAVDGLVVRLATALLLMTMAGGLGQVVMVTGQQQQTRPLYKLEGRELLVYTGAYGALMALIAAVC